MAKASLLRKLNFTRDYNAFSYLPNKINRKLEKPHVKTLEYSLKAIGALRVVICAYVSFLDPNKLYVIDGQHLIEASMLTDDEIAYVILEISTKKELVRTIALLNSSSKNWKIQDYVTSWAWLLPDYRVINEAAMKYRLPLSAIICAYTLLDTRNTKPVREGEMKVTDKESGAIISEALHELYTLIPRSNRNITRNFTEQFCAMYYGDKTGYAHDAFVKYIKRNMNTMVFLPDRPEEWKKFMASYGRRKKSL